MDIIINRPAEDEAWIDLTKFIGNYLHDQNNTDKIHEMLENNTHRLALDLNDIRKRNPQLAHQILNEPQKSIQSFQRALNHLIEEKNMNELDSGNQKGGMGGKKKTADVRNQTETTYRVTFTGDFGQNMVTPRGLTCHLVNQMVAIQGIVTKISQTRPKWLRSVHFCEQTEKGIIREYIDDTDISMPTAQKGARSIPLKDENNNPLQMEFGFCKFKDHQTIVIQELPENAPTGSLPRSVEVVVEEDLVDNVKPGDKIQINGMYRGVPTASTSSSGIFKSVLVASSLMSIQNHSDSLNPTPTEIKEIKNLAKRNDVFEVLSASIAPSIYGHKNIKKAILLQLLGGAEKVLRNGGHLRGDINLLMVGDPSTAQSQMLRFVMGTAPLALNTTGRGSSGVGLTAAVVKDPETGHRHLEAGAMVLGDRGIVCIDEFDKMEEADRVAIHEVMEQQTVTIAKAGIHCSLNARCSVLAAANPVYGEYQKDLSVSRNVNLPDSLLSRFDLLFLVFDQKDSEKDRLIAERVTRNHRFCQQNRDLMKLGYNSLDDDYVIEPDYAMEDEQDASIYETNTGFISEDQGQILTQNFLKKYIAYCKMNVTDPVMQDDAADYIVKQWEILRENEDRSKGQRNQGIEQIMPITIRTLESIIRLATAHSKLRNSKQIEIVDCAAALRLLQATLRPGEDDSDLDEEGSDDDENSSYHEDSENPEGGRGRSRQMGGRVEKKNNTSHQKSVQKDTTPKPTTGSSSTTKNNITVESGEKRVTRSNAMDLEELQNEFNTSTRQPMNKVANYRKIEPTQDEPVIKRDASRKLQKIKIDDDDDDEYDAENVANQKQIKKAKHALDLNVLASINITFEDKKFVWRQINQMENQFEAQLDDLWTLIRSSDKNQIENFNTLVQVIQVLNDDGKLIFDPDNMNYHLA